MAVQLKVVKSVTNDLLSRKELSLTITHPKLATPTKELIASELSTNYSMPKNQIYVYGISTGYGSHLSQARAHLYSQKDALKKIERSHIVEKLTGEKVAKVARRQRKDIRKKAYKMFGTLQRNMKKASRRSKEE